MKSDRDIDQYNDEVAEMFSDLPPFTITVNDGHDAAFLSSAMMLWVTGGNHELGRKALRLMCDHSLELGVEKGITMFFDEGDRIGYKFPKFMKPLFIHMMAHALKKYKEKQE